MSPPAAPGWTLLTFGAAIGQQMTPSPALLGHLWLEGMPSPSPRGAVLSFWGSCQAASGFVGAPGAGGDASPSPQGAIRDTFRSYRAACGAVAGASRVLGVGGDTSATPPRRHP